ncbi:MAG: hypothetical protein KDC80_10500, partial [Saprospiraceae bacterium]|nr:hypothetical protein [Saprospiraceae bacterium]
DLNRKTIQDPGISVDLGTIEVRARRLDAYVEYHKPTMLYSRPDDRVQVDSSLLSQGQTNIIDFLRGKVPNFEVSNESGDRQVILRGRSTGLSQNTSMSNAAQFMVNGFAVTPAYAETINPLDVEFVDIIRSLSQNSVYGEFGRNGIIAIYLKPPHQRSRKPVEREGMISRMFVGYARSIPFQAGPHPDSNATLYWSGIRQMDSEGMAEMKIPLSGPREDLQIIIEGLTPSGTPLFLSKSISLP